jgi:2-alkenal reductase
MKQGSSQEQREESQYTLVREATSVRRSSGWKSKVTFAVLGGALLVMGAYYVPLLVQSPQVAAAGTLAQVNRPVGQLGATLVDDQEALANLYELVSPSVVNIQVVGTTTAQTMPEIPGFELPPGLEEQPTQGQGSGFIFDNDDHVVEGASEVTVIFYDGRWASAEVVATDPQADLAVLKVTPPEGFNWQPLALASDDGLRVGHIVFAIGNPWGLDGTMTMGIISALGRGYPVGAFGDNRYTLPEVIQTDAAINPGNSGGPLLNLNGEVVGVNFAIESAGRFNSGVAFTIPVSILRKVVPALIAEGKFVYPYLGLQGTTITPSLSEALGLDENVLGIYVSGVVPGGPSAVAGVQGGDDIFTDPDTGLEINRGGDIVIAIDGVSVRRFEDLVGHLVTATTPGSEAVLTILRDGAQIEVPVTIGERPVAAVAVQRDQPQGPVNARQAIEIAEQYAVDQALLDAEVTEKVATPDSVDGKDVWVVELATDAGTVTITVDEATGEVLNAVTE